MTLHDVLTVVLSSCGLLLTILFASRGWHMERLKSRPHCYFVQSVTAKDGIGAGCGWYLRNEGPGIAIIQNWKFSSAGNLLGENRNGVREVENLMGGRIGSSMLNTHWILPPNTTEKLFWIRNQDDAKLLGYQGWKKLLELVIEIRYESVMGEKFVMTNSNARSVPVQELRGVDLES